MLNPGDTIDNKFQIVRLLGKGGMSNIYLCRRTQGTRPGDQAHWVLKEMTVSYRDPEDQKRAVDHFLREALLMQRLQHRNLPKVIHQSVHGNRYYFVMEYVEGEDLGKMLLRHPQGFPESQVVSWAIEIATVLYYLHCQTPQIIFRDVKPSNIMISRGVVKLIDFGIARHFDPFKKKDTMRIGSPGYAPPEQYTGQTDQRSDIYSLGVTLHQLLTGRDPSETQTPFNLPSVRELNPSVSAGMAAILDKATASDQRMRYKTALDMKRALQALIGVRSAPLPAMPPEAPKTAPVSRPTPPPARPVPPAVAPPAIQKPAPPPKAAAKATPPAPLKQAVQPLQALAPPRPAAPVPPLPVPVPARVPRKSRAGIRAFLWLAALFVIGAGGIAAYVQIPEFQRWVISQLTPGPGPTETPQAPDLPEDNTHKALDALSAGRVGEAVDALEGIRWKTPSDGLALIGYDNGLALLGGVPTVTVQLVFPSGTSGADFVRGAALAQRDLNKQGGVQGKRLILSLGEYGFVANASPNAVSAEPDPKYLSQVARDQSALSAIGWVGASLTGLVDAYRQVEIPFIAAASRSGAEISVAPQPQAVEKALVAAVTEIAPQRLALVVVKGWPAEGGERVLQALRVGRRDEDVKMYSVDESGEVPAGLLSSRPDLVVLLGDPMPSARWAKAARRAGLAVGLLAGPGLHADAASEVGGKIFVVSPLAPEPADLDADRFRSAYSRAFGDAKPGYAGAAGYDAVMAWARAAEQPGEWTAAGMTRRLASPAAYNGVTGSVWAGTVSPWHLLKFDNGGWTAVKAMVP
ncbi:MAG: hypothetical protein FJX76_19250 [Armatimonadetes bacterium]|nr:hypothetical protein [Armatimonadota bacterium]